MSYSQWGDSRWYTYRGAFNKKVPREEQEFVVCTVGSVTYGKIKHDFEAAVSQLVEQCVEAGEHKPLTSEIEELRGYMRQFMREVEAE